MVEWSTMEWDMLEKNVMDDGWMEGDVMEYSCSAGNIVVFLVRELNRMERNMRA